MTDVKLVSLPGDGIGSEVVEAALTVLTSAGERWGVRFVVEPVEAGAARYARTGIVYREADFELCRSADAILLGALGLPDVTHRDGTEAGPDLQFRLRFDLDLYAGVRPVRRYASTPGPLATREGFSFTIIRENTEGLYASRGGGTAVGDKVATDTLIVTSAGADRIIRFAFDYALATPPLSGHPLVTCVDKANVLRSYAFFRSRFDAIAKEYEERVRTSRVYVDAFCAQMVLRPTSIHVAVAENMFGDIVSDLAAGIVGGLGLAPSGDIGERHGVFQPSHGSAPTIAGKDEANPIATILSSAMMLDWLSRSNSANVLRGMAADIRSAVERTLDDPASRTRDLDGAAGTRACASSVVANLLGPV
ncbi:MAG: isocitrate/isopropylmalate dehydrogenase family protein [Hyphomicrobiales bacterium]|nr:isocitrate/isopropylmalate dehydrogenase family protein [Hyphomicrobiales bacterium]